jgi:PAS domain S-box-containing protein
MDIQYLFDDLTDGLWDLDIPNKIVYLSPNASKLFGHVQPVIHKYEEILYTSVHEDFRDKLKDEFGQLLRNRIDILDIKIKIRSTLKEWKWVHFRGKIISRETDGSPNRLLGSVTDISKCKIAEEEIKKERKISRSVIDNLPATIYIMDSMGRKIVSNKTDCELIGAKEESEVIGKTDLELYPGKTGERGHMDNINVIKNKKPVVNREEVFSDGNGNQKWLLTSKIPLFNDDNQILGLLGIGIDITKQKNLQQKITESETFYRTLINISPNGVVVTDLEGKITFLSKMAYKIFKIPDGENQIGKSIFNWVAPGSLSMAKAHFREVLEDKRPQRSEEYNCLNYDKTEFWAEMSSSPLCDFSGKSIGLMIVSRDITDRKKIEMDLISAKNKAEENDKLKTAFLHNISHEIRTPLNAIVGFSSLLDDLNLSRVQQKSYIEIINKSSDHLLEIISDILEISNIEAGIVKVNEYDLDLNDQIEDLFNQFNLDFKRKNIQLERSFGIQNEIVIIRTDKTKLVQILSNLISNSLKFTDTGTIKFGYKVEENNLQFYVSDTGKGIQENEFQKIFDRFYQVEHTLNRPHEGTGLGLSICKAYVELLGGQIWLTSKVGEGTTFNFTIPFNRVNILLESNENFYTEEQTSFARNKTILIAEDDDNNFSLLCKILQSLEHNIIRAKDGFEAIERVKTVPKIDLVLMDIKMPGLDGYEATRRIKDIHPNLPVIALTAHYSESEKRNAPNIGFVDFISKPYSRRVLIDTLNRILN